MEFLYSLGASNVLWLQNKARFLEPFFLWFSHLGDPRNAFLVFFPLCYSFRRNLGVQCLWISSLTEWINAILKWFFIDDRPYWWVMERQFGHELMQFPITCETGPGFPSGHVMSIAAVGLHVILAVDNHVAITTSIDNNLKLLIKVFLFTIYSVVIFAVAISRIYIATHFPHQVIVAVFIGIFITLTINKVSNSMDLSSGLLCTITSFGMLVFAVLFHEILVVSGHDPSSTVSLAEKWCKEKRWVHLDTTPFYAVVRDCATLLGLGLLSFTNSRNEQFFSYWSLAVSMILNVVVLQLVENINITHENFLLFYFRAYIKFTILPIIVTFVIPCLLNFLEISVTFSLSDKEK